MITSSKRMKVFGRSVLLAGSLAGLLAGGVHAQDTQQTSLDDPFNIPNDVQILGQNPNLRRATARVNGDVITGTDVEQRVALVLAANQAAPSEEELQRLRLQVLRNLIDETLQIQEAGAQDLAVSDEEVEQTYRNVASQRFKQDTSEMNAYLRSIGSSPASLQRQIRGELSWNRLLQRNIQPFVNVSASEVNELQDRLKASRGTDEYRLGEIYLSATPATRDTVFQNAQQIVEQLKQGGSFVAYARQYSQASTAAVGGDLGWIRLEQLQNPQLENSARTLEPGQLVGPVEIPGGFSILYLIDKRQVGVADPRDAILSLKQISIELPKGMAEDQARQRIASFSDAVGKIRGCGDADQAAAAMGASVVSSDQLPVRNLPEALQQTLLQLNVGQSTPPFGSIEEGVRVLLLCGRDDPQSGSATPNFDALMAQLEDDRINRRAQRYLRDLRRDAVIEYN
nr:peptidylprolyl isomerase [Altericroceibacterium xinjiangense]